jgi:hypothetical protein
MAKSSKSPNQVLQVAHALGKQRLRTYWNRFNHEKYGQRWQVDTVNSMFKRSMNSALRERTYWSQSREITLLVLTHNIMILWHD